MPLLRISVDALRARVAAVDADLGVGHLRGGLAAQLAHDLDHVRDAEHVRVREHPAVRVGGELARVEVRACRRSTNSPPAPFSQKPLSSICISVTIVNGS